MPTTRKHSSRSTRLKACELAAVCMQGQGNDGAVGPRLMSLVVFFETYIDEGAHATQSVMRLLARPGRKNLKVVAGGGLA